MKTNVLPPRPFTRRKAAGLSLAAAVAAVLSAQSARATTITWDGGGGGGTDLGTAVNWSGDTLPSVVVPDTALWDGTVAGPLSLIYSDAAFAGAPGDPGLDFSIAATQTAALNIDSGLNTNALRLNNITIATGAGAFSLGNGVDVFNLTLGGAPGTHTWTNDSSNTAIISSEVVLGTDGGGAHVLALGGTGNWTLNNVITNSSGTVSLTKSGNGALTLSGVNTYTGGTTLSAGTINIANAAALGNTATGGLTVAGNSTINNTSGGALTLTAAKAIALNADLTFTGSNDLNFGTGNVTLGGAAGTRILGVNAGILRVNGLVGAAGLNISKTGAGTLFLTNTSNNSTTVAGTVDIAAGMIQVGADHRFGGLTGTGIIENGTASGRWIRTNGNYDYSFGGTLRNGTSARLGYQKEGTGTFTLTGTMGAAGAGTDYFGIVNGKVVLPAGATVFIGGAAYGSSDIGNTGNAANNGILEINGGTFNALRTTNPGFTVGAGNNARGFVKMNSGTLAVTEQLKIGNASTAGTNAYAAFTMTGGTVTSGSWLVVGLNNDRAQLNQSGGTLTVNTNRMTIGAGGNASIGVVNLSGGTFTVNAGGNTGIFLGENGTGTLTLSGSSALTLNTTGAAASGTMQFGGNATSLAGNFNLNGGTLTAFGVTKGASTAGAVYRFNFNGGTLKANASNAAFFASLANTTAYVNSGGAVFDTNGFDVTVAQPLLAPTDSGLNAIAVATGGVGYVDAPVVTLAGGVGTGATAIANVSGGVVTSFTITNPGTGYAPGDVLTATLFGGGATTAATVGALTLTPNVSGGLTKNGNGMLTLTGTNTYTGTTTVNAGTLTPGVNDVLADTSAVNVNGGTLNMAANSDTVDAVTLTSGTITSSGGILTGSSFNVQSGTVSGILSGGALTKTTAGTVTISSVNAYTGTTTVSAGTLTLSGAGEINSSSGITVNGIGAKLLQTSSTSVTPTVTLTTGTLDGTGTVNAVNVGGGTGAIIANGNGGTGALTIGNLSFGGAATLNLTTASTSAVLLTTNLTTGGGIITINATNTGWTNGSTYSLIGYSSLTGALGHFAKGTIANLGGRQSATLGNSGSAITLAIAGDLPFWTGATNGNWVTDPTLNWKLQTGGTATNFQVNDTVLFNDNVSVVTTAVTITGNVAPISTTFSNSTNNYTIGGVFGITTGLLIKDGTGSVTISTANSYPGGTTVNAGTLVLSGNNNFGVGGFTINAGTVTLSGTNAYTGATVLNAGTLNINNASAIGTGVLTLSGGTIDNTNGGATLTTSTPELWTNGASVAFTGTNALNLGTGAVTLGVDAADAAFTLTNNSALGGTSLTVGGTITPGTGGTPGTKTLTIAGVGRTALTGNFSKGTANALVVTDTSPGTLILSGAASSISTLNLDGGAGSIVDLGAGSLNVGNGGGNIVQSLTGGTINGSGANALVIGSAGGDFGTAGGTTLTVNALITGANTVDFWNANGGSGFGNVVLTAANTHTGGVNVQNVRLVLPAGSALNALNTANVGQITVGDQTGLPAVLEINGGTINATKNTSPSFAVGSVTGALGAVTLNSGAISTTSEFHLGRGQGGYASFTMNGGSLTAGNWLVVGFNNDSAVLNQNGGTINVAANRMTIGAGGGGSVGVVNQTGGTFTVAAGADSGIYPGENGTGTYTISGSAAMTLNTNGTVNSGTVQFGKAASALAGNVNLNGGTLTTFGFTKGASSGGAIYRVNFNGGTLRANASNPVFFADIANTEAYVNAGGALIDTNGFNIDIAKPLLAPSGDGISAFNVTGGTGYIGEPLVQISGDGTGATARATIDSSGNVTGITITNRGINYTFASATLVGGGGTGATVDPATLTANPSGGLTKSGNGILTLTGNSTYTGPTTVSAGTLLLGNFGDINASSGITINGAGAKLVQNSSTTVTPAVTVTNGTLDGTTTYTAATVSDGALGAVANGNGGTGALTVTDLTFNGQGTMNLSVASQSPVLLVPGSLTTGAVNVAGKVTLNATSATWTSGQQYDLISYGTLSGAGFGGFVLGTITGLTPRQGVTLLNPAGLISLSITGGAIPVWSGDLNGIGEWTPNTLAAPKNWKLQPGGSATDFLNGDTVLFNDAATGTTTVSISTADVNPTSTTFSNSTKNYTISSAGGFRIASGFLTKGGTGTVTISTHNTYTGGTTVNDGTLNMTGNNSFGIGGVTVNGGTASFSGNNSYTGSTTVNLGTLIMSGNNNFGAGVVTVNGGTATFSGVNTYTSPTLLTNGTLNVNNPGALGSAALTITGGVLGNTSAGDVLLTAAKAMNWNGDFSYNGPGNLDFNLGAVTIGGTVESRTITVAAGTLSTGIITAAAGYGLTKAGPGNLAMTNTANTTTIAGELNITGGRVQAAGDFFVGGLTGGGTFENGGAASKWIYVNNAADNVFSGTIQDNPNIAGVRMGFVKRGAATLTLSGTNSATDRLAVENGKLILTGNTTTGYGTGGNQTVVVGNIAGVNAILEINGGTLNANKTNNPGLSIAPVANGSGAIKMTSGALTTLSELHIGNGNGAIGTEPYAALTLSGGLLTSGNWLVVGADNDRAVLNQSGGSIVVSANRMTIGAGGAGSVGVANLSGGTLTDNGGIFVGENGTGTLNVSGTHTMSLGAAGTLQFGGNATSLAGTVNLLGGSVSANSVTQGAGSGIYLLNFNGGELKATASTAAFIGSGAPLAGTTAYLYAGGGTIDDDGFAITISQPILAPTGNGVSATGLAVSGGGYIDTPLVEIIGDGIGASAVALIDSNGDLTGITMTNPGTGYTSAPAFFLRGGGLGNFGNLTGSATLVANTSGTLNKEGTGQTTFAAAIGDGTSSFHAKGGETVFTTAQTFAALTIDDGALVSVGLGAAPFEGDAMSAGDSMIAPAAVVPEPGSASLLLLGALGVLARRRRSR